MTDEQTTTLARQPSDESAKPCSLSNRIGFRERFFRKAASRILSRIQQGSLTLMEGEDSCRFGESIGPSVSLTIRSPQFYRNLVLGGSLGVAESYMNAEWIAEDLTAVFRVMAGNLSHLEDMRGPFATAGRRLARTRHWLRRNTRIGSKRNIQAHYDLGNDLFELMLDKSMMYSSAIFPCPTSTLEEASQAKLQTICEKLKLTEADHVIEIGTGWGGFACYAAKQFGCRVTSTTISQEQYNFAKARVKREGLQDQVTLLFEDYRELTGQYEKLVSIEMIEAVGERFLAEYVKKCETLLRPDGLMLIQGIVMPEQRYERYRRSVDFIQKYIFPGGFLPSVGRVHSLMGSQTDLQLLHLEDLSPHYAQTLREWRRRFEAGLEQLRTCGYSEQFLRLWEYYLCYCEAAFEERAVGVVQWLASRSAARHDTRGVFEGVPA